MSPHAVSDPAIPIPNLGRQTSDPRRSELDTLRAQLKIRASITDFAHAAVSMLLASIIGGAAIKLLRDSPKFALLGKGVALVALGLLTYALVRTALGRSKLKREKALFTRMNRLRAELNLDDPSSLLPNE